jgi:hypothetical protein
VPKVEASLIPDLIEKLEQYDVAIIKLSNVCKDKIQFGRWSVRRQARDFRINHEKVRHLMPRDNDKDTEKRQDNDDEEDESDCPATQLDQEAEYDDDDDEHEDELDEEEHDDDDVDEDEIPTRQIKRRRQCFMREDDDSG